jgi:hypothetical protein
LGGGGGTNQVPLENILAAASSCKVLLLLALAKSSLSPVTGIAAGAAVCLAATTGLDLAGADTASPVSSGANKIKPAVATAATAIAECVLLQVMAWHSQKE